MHKSLIFVIGIICLVGPTLSVTATDYDEGITITDEENELLATEHQSTNTEYQESDNTGDSSYDTDGSGFYEVTDNFTDSSLRTGGMDEDYFDEEERAYLTCGRRGILPSLFSEDEENEERTWSQASFAENDEEEPLVRIIAGRVTSPLEFPWQVSIHRKGRHICGGSIVGRRYILSAAHCFKVRNRRMYKIYGGKQSKLAGEYGEVGPFYIQSVIIHRSYNMKSRHDSDIALIKLTKPIRYSNKVRAICLPPRNSYNVRPGTRCYVSGYGRTKGTGGDKQLKAARVSVLGHEQCKRMTSSWARGLITGNMICAGGIKLDDGTTCKGDSGGPLVCETHRGSNVFALQGIVSFGKRNCGDSKYTPGVYVRVARFFTWAKKNFNRLEKMKM